MHSLCNKDLLTILQLSDQQAWCFCLWRFGPSAPSLRISRSFPMANLPSWKFKLPTFKRKKEKPVKAATALSLASRALCNFVLLNPGAYAPGFIPPPTFVGSYQGGTPPFPGAPRGPSPTSWTLIIHGGSPPFPGAAPDPSRTSWTLIIHGGSPPFPVTPLARPSPTSLALIIMSVLLLSACRFGNPLVYLVALIVLIV